MDTPAEIAAPVAAGVAAVDIGDLSNDGAQIDSFRSPAGYAQKSGLIAYEGPGWESDRVGWRVYLDDRNAIDIFGKRTSDAVLASVGRGEDYHEMADWGMDILKVGNSLGAGGFGVFENGEVRQIGMAEGYDAEVAQRNAGRAGVRVTHRGSKACGGDVSATYTAMAGSRLSEVDLDGTCALPLATGLVIHPGTTSIVSNGASGWQYKARWGDQSLVPDGLGMAIFYRAEDAAEVGADADDDYVVFKPNLAPTYRIAAAWSQEEGDAVTTEAGFRDWLDATQSRLNR